MEERIQLLQRVLNVMQNKSHQLDIIEHCSQILTQVISKATQASTTELPQLVDKLNQPEKLFDISVSSGQAQVLQLIVDILEYIKKRTTASKSHDNKEDEEVVYD